MSRTNLVKEDKPSPRAYRALVRSARDKVTQQKRDDEELRLECELIIRLLGELGMRAGEISHLEEEWVDFGNEVITIPEHRECTGGQDGGPCGYCKKQARQMANKDSNDMSYERALREYWRPKNDNAARDIWFGWNDDMFDLLDEYLALHGEYPHSRVSINRRVTQIAEESSRVEAESVYPHALRAHAAMYHARKGVRAFQLSQFMGWSDVSFAMDYIKMAADDVETEFKRAHGRSMGDW